MSTPHSVAVAKHAAKARKRISLLVPQDLRDALVELSQRERRTLNAQCEVFLTAAVERARSRDTSNEA